MEGECKTSLPFGGMDMTKTEKEVMCYEKLVGSGFLFKVGFKKTDVFGFFGRICSIVVKLKAYCEKDGITSEQLEAYKHYVENKKNIQTLVENEFSKPQYNKDNLTPKTLLINRKGEVALLVQDAADLDGGLVVVIKPEFKVVPQDEYL